MQHRDTRSPRRRGALALVIIASVIGLDPGSAGAQAIRIPESTVYRLENGLQVTLVEQHAAPLIEVRMGIPAGVAHEPDSREGLARFMAELLTQGTARRSATEFAAALDQIGAELSATGLRDFLDVSLSTLARHRSTALELMADCVLNPTFPDAEIERTRQRLIAAVQQQGEDPGELADVALWQASFAGDPYGRRADGGQASLTAITAGEIRDFHRTHVIPAGSVLVAVGDFETGAMRKEIDRLFGGWKGGSGGTAAKPPARAEMTGGKLVLVNKPELVQSQLRISYPGVPRGHEDEAPLLLSTAILGGGFTSRLLEALRVERSLVYSVACQSVQQGRGGLARVFTATKTPTTRQALDVTLAEIERFRNQGPDAEELAGIKNFLSGIVARSLQSPADIAQSLSVAAYYGLPPDYIARRVERIRAVTVDDVRRVSQKHFDAAGRTIVLVADGAAVRDSLGTFGTLRETSFETLLE